MIFTISLVASSPRAAPATAGDCWNPLLSANATGAITCAQKSTQIQAGRRYWVRTEVISNSPGKTRGQHHCCRAESTFPRVERKYPENQQIRLCAMMAQSHINNIGTWECPTEENFFRPDENFIPTSEPMKI
jgi:hypothetical protein